MKPTQLESPGTVPTHLPEDTSLTNPTSKELVPLSYYRTAWNTLHGKALEHHDDLLTGDEAARINNNFTIDIFVGVHGLVPESPEDAKDSSYADKEPTEVEYAEAAAVVAGMRPGIDTLFVENLGFARQPHRVPQKSQSPDRPLLLARPRNAVMQARLQRFMQRDSTQQRLELEGKRKNRTIHAWDYAVMLARQKGVQVVYADQDEFDKERLVKVQGYDPLKGTKSESGARQNSKRLREKAARNVVKDWALDHLSSLESQAPPSAEKPRLVLLFGAGHKEGLVSVFDDVYLSTTVHELVMSSLEERLQEHFSRTYAIDRPTSSRRIGGLIMGPGTLFPPGTFLGQTPISGNWNLHPINRSGAHHAPKRPPPDSHTNG